MEGKDRYLKFYSVCCFSFSVLHLKDFVKRKWELRVFKLLPVLTMTFSNTLSSILSSSLMKSTFLFSLQSFYFPACLKLIGGKKKIVLLDTVTTFTFFPFFFFLLRVDYFGEEIEFLILSNISRIPSVKSLLPSFLLFTDLCILCSVQNKHVTNHMVCNFLSFFSLSTP